MTFDFAFFLEALRATILAVPLTLFITASACLLGAVIGSLVAVVRARKVRVLYPLVRAYVSVVRGTPALLHLMIVVLALPVLLDGVAQRWGWRLRSTAVPLPFFVILALSLTAGAYVAEIVRAGILAVPHSQVEAGESIGMTHWQLMRRIVLPQAAAASLPGLCNLYVGLLHGSSLAYLVAVREMTGTATVLASRQWNYLEAYVAVALLYWGLTIVVERGALLLERRWQTRLSGAAP